LRDAAHGDVAVGDHADEAIILADRQYAGVDIGHHLGGGVQRIAGLDHLDVDGHQLAYLHASSSQRRGAPRHI